MTFHNRKCDGKGGGWKGLESKGNLGALIRRPRTDSKARVLSDHKTI